MSPVSHPGKLLKREIQARGLSANALALDLGVPSGRVTDILNGRRSITADTAIRLGLYFGNSPACWTGLQSRYDIARVQRDRGTEIARRVRPAGLAPLQSGLVFGSGPAPVGQAVPATSSFRRSPKQIRGPSK